MYWNNGIEFNKKKIKLKTLALYLETSNQGNLEHILFNKLLPKYPSRTFPFVSRSTILKIQFTVKKSSHKNIQNWSFVSRAWVNRIFVREDNPWNEKVKRVIYGNFMENTILFEIYLLKFKKTYIKKLKIEKLVWESIIFV